MKIIWQWILSIWALLGFIKRTTMPEDVPQQSNWNPLLAAAVERERKQMILRKLREFFQHKPPSWISPNARATRLKQQRRNAREQINKRLHSRKGIA